jgi:hypothetical protein
MEGNIENFIPKIKIILKCYSSILNILWGCIKVFLTGLKISLQPNFLAASSCNTGSPP